MPILTVEQEVRKTWGVLFDAARAQRGRTRVAQRAWRKDLHEAALEYAEKVRRYSEEDYDEECS